MPEPIDWLEDASDSAHGKLEQARDVFLAGCGLPEAWQSKNQWRILETGFGLGLNFLLTWAAWKADPLRPQMLHFVSTEAGPARPDDVLRNAAFHPLLLPLAKQLKAQLWGLLPGFHRLVFGAGRVLLTLCIGDTKVMLRQQQFEADSVYLDGFSSQKNPDIWDVHTFKAVARCCRRGTRLASWAITRSVQDGLAQAGFVVHKTPGIAPERDSLQGEYNPAWEPKRAAQRTHTAVQEPGTCVVIGAGLAGAAVAASLARRGWQVTVLDAADKPASGASALPAGFLVPHVSPDDSLLSRLSRSGVRQTLQQADALLQRGADWAHSGVLQHIVDGSTKNLPQDWSTALQHEAADWSQIANAEQLAKCGLPASASALWHAQAGWIKPAELVKAWLQTPGVTWRSKARAAHLQAAQNGWQVLNESHEVLAQADLVVLAAAYDSRALAATVNAAELALQPVRGQVSWGMHSAQPAHWPAFPVNGNGSLAPTVPLAGGLAWVVGASYERDCAAPKVCPRDHQENLARLQTLLPETAAQMERAGAFDDTQVKGWSGIRCATPGRLPLLAQIATSVADAPVWVCTGMGSRGLTFAVLCAELLAARLHGEPLPLEQRLAQALERNVRA